MTRINGNKKRGFTLFIAVVTASIVLAVGMSILQITLKEFILSGVTRDSLIAFNAADAGIECAAYWDESEEAMGADVFGRFHPNYAGPYEITCMGEDIDIDEVDLDGDPFEFEVEWGDPEVCAVVSVEKYSCGSGGTFICTKYVSYGYNRACASIDDPRAVERGIEMTYQ